MESFKLRKRERQEGQSLYGLLPKLILCFDPALCGTWSEMLHIFNNKPFALSPAVAEIEG